MDISMLLIKTYQLLDEAQVEDGIGNTKHSIAALAQLRELLNEQPELEAGGACEPTEPNKE